MLQSSFFNDPKHPFETGALFSPCRTWRYRLWRVWDRDKPRCLFIMLNPSTADESVNDPTITRCIKYADSWGLGSLEVCNVFALRSRDPKELRHCDDPVGPWNDGVIIEAATKAAFIACAWGVHGLYMDRGRKVAGLLSGFRLHCLGLTQDGAPRHPLYMASGCIPLPYREV